MINKNGKRITYTKDAQKAKRDASNKALNIKSLKNMTKKELENLVALLLEERK